MDNQQLLDVLNTYEKKMKRLNVTPYEVKLRRTIHHMESRNLVLGHCYTAIREMKKQVETGVTDGVRENLHFIQGCFWTNGVYTINQIRQHNHPK